MTDPQNADSAKRNPQQGAERERLRAETLRANLKRRKIQARKRAEEPSAAETGSGTENPPDA
jgi:hypothetical protein